MSSKHVFNNKVKSGLRLGLYGKITYKAVAYCELHKCYLEPLNIREKRCNFKKCKYFKRM